MWELTELRDYVPKGRTCEIVLIETGIAPDEDFARKRVVYGCGVASRVTIWDESSDVTPERYCPYCGGKLEDSSDE